MKPSKVLPRNIYETEDEAERSALATLIPGAGFYVWRIGSADHIEEFDWTAIPQPPSHHDWLLVKHGHTPGSTPASRKLADRCETCATDRESLPTTQGGEKPCA